MYKTTLKTIGLVGDQMVTPWVLPEMLTEKDIVQFAFCKYYTVRFLLNAVASSVDLERN